MEASLSGVPRYVEWPMMTPASAIAFATSNSGYLFFTEYS